MKRIIPVVLTILALSAVSFAQTTEEMIEKALLPAPRNMKDGATVIKWKSDFTYDTLRKGTNGLVCYDRSGFPLQLAFAVQCTSLGNLAREAQNLKAEASGDRAKSEAMLKAMEQDGTRAKPEFGS